jgi:monoamine oxidase
MSYLQFNPHNQGPLPENAAKQTKTQQGSIKRSFSDWIIKNYGSEYLETLKKQRSKEGAKRFSNCAASDQPVVGIIGGGFAGMYAGLILQSLGIESQIFEGSERVGGRIDTWYSSNYDADNKQTAGLYGEMGGMRLPQYSEDMLPVQHLALAVNAVLKSNNMADKLVEWRKFYYDSPVQRMRYNNMDEPIEVQNSRLNSLNFGTDEGGDIPMVWVTPTTQGSYTEYLPIKVILDKVNGEFIDALNKSFAGGFEKLMAFDNYSMWGYLTNVFTLGQLGEYYQESMGPKDANLSYNVTSYLETMNVGTGMYSVSFVEMVIVVYDWGGSKNSYDPCDLDIYMLTVDKGMQNFPDACKAVLNLESGVTADVGYAAQQQIGMIRGTNEQKGYSPDNLTAAAQPPSSVPKAETIPSNPPPASKAKQRVFMNHQVLGTVHDPSLYNGLGGMKVTVKDKNGQGDAVERHFPYVISTLPNGKYLNGQASFDFFEDLSFSKARALRESNYMPSFKAFITFDSQFWAKLGERQDAGLGVGTTDRSNRQIVYPSYGYDADAGVLQVYCWAQDAERLGALTDEEAINECLKGIQYLYPEVDVMAEYAKYNPDVTTKTWFWDNHAGGGAFAMFNPGQFKNLYPTLLTPEFDGCLNFAGECCSVHHGWIVGALDSAYNAVYNIIQQSGDKALLDQMERTWGVLAAPDIESRSKRVQKMLA